jgi:bifunctional enzyme Fae/Hps
MERKRKTEGKTRLERRQKYLQVALNGELAAAESVVRSLPDSERILIEIGTPLLKSVGASAISRIRFLRPRAYLVADSKCSDMAPQEVALLAGAGAQAVTALGVAPLATLDAFVAACAERGVDSMIDMMNVADPLSLLRQLKKAPDVVILHRGVDEGEATKGKPIPYYQIKKIKGAYTCLVAVAGGDSAREVQSAVFNDADIVVVWKGFSEPGPESRQLAETFLSQVH